MTSTDRPALAWAGTATSSSGCILEFDAGLDERSITRLSERALTGETVTFETRHRRKDGIEFPVEIRSGTFKKGDRLFFLSLARDITERKQAEERKAKLVAIVESSDDAIISMDLDGIITTWNPAAERIFGYAAREAIGQSTGDTVPPDRADEVGDTLERMARGERVRHFETVRCRKDGTLLDMSLTVSRSSMRAARSSAYPRLRATSASASAPRTPCAKRRSALETDPDGARTRARV